MNLDKRVIGLAAMAAMVCVSAGWAPVGSRAAAVLVGAVGGVEGLEGGERALGVTTPELIREFGGEKSVTRPSMDAVMGFGIATRVTEIVRRGGERVKKGDVILKGDDGEDKALLKLQKLRAESDVPVQRAKAAMDQSKVEFERLEDALRKGASGPQEVERARLQYEVARLDYLNAQQQQTQEQLQYERLIARVDKYSVRAPFDGIVDVVQADVGQVIAENDKVVRVVSVDALWIDAHARTDDPITLVLAKGDTANVLIDRGGQAAVVTAKVIEVAPTSDPASRTRRIRIEIDNTGGRPETGGVRILAGEPVWVRFGPLPQAIEDRATKALSSAK